MLTFAPGVILPATPVAASIMMAISCCPAFSAGRLAIISVWSSDPWLSLVAAILPRTSERSVTAVEGTQRSGIDTFSKSPASRASYASTFPFSLYAVVSGPTFDSTSLTTESTPANAPPAHRTDRTSRMTPRRWREFMDGQPREWDVYRLVKAGRSADWVRAGISSPRGTGQEQKAQR